MLWHPHPAHGHDNVQLIFLTSPPWVSTWPNLWVINYDICTLRIDMTQSVGDMLWHHHPAHWPDTICRWYVTTASPHALTWPNPQVICYDILTPHIGMTQSAGDILWHPHPTYWHDTIRGWYIMTPSPHALTWYNPRVICYDTLTPRIGMTQSMGDSYDILTRTLTWPNLQVIYYDILTPRIDMTQSMGDNIMTSSLRTWT